MAMVDTVYWLPIGGPVAEDGWLGPKVGGHLAPCCIYRVNWLNSRSGSAWLIKTSMGLGLRMEAPPYRRRLPLLMGGTFSRKIKKWVLKCVFWCIRAHAASEGRTWKWRNAR